MVREVKKKTIIGLVLIAGCYGLMCLRGSTGSLVLEATVFCLEIYVLVTAAGRFTGLAVSVGKSLGMSKLATGILIIAIGTSAPELFASIGAAFQNQPEMVVGNVLGTVIANSLLGIGCGALVAMGPLTVHRDVVGTQMSILLVAIMLAIGGLYDGVLVWYEGVVMVVLLVFYIYKVIKGKKDEDEDASGADQANSNGQRTFKIGTAILLGMNLGALLMAGDVVVSTLVEAAAILDYSGAKLATTILAVGTSIPEIATAVALVRQRNADSLFGEVIGSNIIDILGILGGISMVKKLTMEAGLLVYLAASVFVMFVVVNTMMSDKRVDRVEGVALVLLYVMFAVQMVNV